ncbi:MAG: zinc ABC transporter substrate-binding protein [Motiliproteus sp.]|nr:zinc ABC transporter substrate-binding protein [Motiliproteus sp.]
MIQSQILRRIAPFLLLITASASSQAVEVVTTIKPLQLIAAAVMKGVAQPQLLLPSNASPHDYQLRPSDVRKLQQADLLFWIGPELESFLEKSLRTTETSNRAIALLEQLESQPQQKSASHQEGHDDHNDHANHQDHKDHEEHENHQAHKDHDEHADHQEHMDHDDHADHQEHMDHDQHENPEEQGHHHDHNGVDPHIWLSPVMAKQIAEHMVEALVAVDAANAEQYQQNFSHFQKQLEQTDHLLETKLESLRNRGYYVFHDAYGHFEQHYQLKHLGAFTVDPSRRPGAKHLIEIRQKLENSEAVCIFSEPQFKPAVIESITEGLDLNRGTLDPLASDFKISANGYIDFLTSMAEQFQQCLSKKIK